METNRELAEELVVGLTTNTGVLAEVLDDDPTSEAGLTALADLALIGSVLERSTVVGKLGGLAETIRVVLSAPALCKGVEVAGPEAWALHASRTWLNPAMERKRLEDPLMRGIVEDSKRRVLALGPDWRSEEIAYVEMALSGSPLPALRRVKVDTSMTSFYELAHVAFYATDFGTRPSRDDLAAELADTAAKVIRDLDVSHCNWDVGVEVILAARYLSGEWPQQGRLWMETLVPNWAQSALSILRDNPRRFLSLYHAMAMTALALAQATGNL